LSGASNSVQAKRKQTGETAGSSVLIGVSAATANEPDPMLRLFVSQ